jgi:hypothetical protein
MIMEGCGDIDFVHPVPDGLSSQAMEPQASPPKASIPDADSVEPMILVLEEFINSAADEGFAPYRLLAAPTVLQQLSRAGERPILLLGVPVQEIDTWSWGWMLQVKRPDSSEIVNYSTSIARAMETGTAKTEGLGAKHDSAGRKALPETSEDHP